MKGEEIILLIHFTNMQLQAGKSSRKRETKCIITVLAFSAGSHVICRG